jgi:hypothetical protein
MSNVSSSGRRTAFALLVSVVTVAIVGIVFTLLRLRPESLTAGYRLAALRVARLDGTPVILAAGGGANHAWIVVKPSCHLCRAELAKLERDGARTPFDVVSLGSVEETRKLMASLPRLRTRTFATGGELEQAYERFRVPTILLLGPDGRILARSRDATSHLDELSKPMLASAP